MKVGSLRETTSPLRIAIFGGSFDPPHTAHIELLTRIQKNQAQNLQAFHKIIVVPSKFPPGKTPVAPYKDRLRWAQKVFVGPGLEVSSFEEASSQTLFGIDIVSHFKSQYPAAEIFWILGEDQWDSLAYWRQIELYAADVHWLVMPRVSSASRISGLLSRRLLGSSSSYHWAATDEILPVSSSEIRERIKKAHESATSENIAGIPASIEDEVKSFYASMEARGGHE